MMYRHVQKKPWWCYTLDAKIFFELVQPFPAARQTRISHSMIAWPYLLKRDSKIESNQIFTFFSQRSKLLLTGINFCLSASCHAKAKQRSYSKLVQGYRDMVHEIMALNSARKHPNIVAFLGACVEDALAPILLEELVRGESLEKFFKVRTFEIYSSLLILLAELVHVESFRGVFQVILVLFCSPPVLLQELMHAESFKRFFQIIVLFCAYLARTAGTCGVVKVYLCCERPVLCLSCSHKSSCRRIVCSIVSDEHFQMLVFSDRAVQGIQTYLWLRHQELIFSVSPPDDQLRSRCIQLWLLCRGVQELKNWCASGTANVWYVQTHPHADSRTHMDGLIPSKESESHQERGNRTTQTPKMIWNSRDQDMNR